MAYPSPSTINGSKGIGEMITYVNDVTSNWFGHFLLIAIYFIFLFGYLRGKGDDDIVGAMAVSGYATFLLSLILWIGGFVSGLAFGICIGVALIGTIALLLDRRGTA